MILAIRMRLFKRTNRKKIDIKIAMLMTGDVCGKRQMALTSRERVRKNLGLKEPDRVPKWISFTPLVLDEFKKKTGEDNPIVYFKIDFREVRLNLTKRMRILVAIVKERALGVA